MSATIERKRPDGLRGRGDRQAPLRVGPESMVVDQTVRLEAKVNLGRRMTALLRRAPLRGMHGGKEHDVASGHGTGEAVASAAASTSTAGRA